jgi:hypothetical protein
MLAEYPAARVAAIANGIEVDRARLRTHQPRERPSLVLLASAPYEWHGIDKVLSLAAALPEFDFDIVCPLAEEIDVPPNVRVHGYLSSDAFAKVLARADAAFAGLAFHRIGLTQACPLKVREYLVHGLPVILGYDDPDLADDPWFALTLPNREDNVASSIDCIRAFVHDVAGKRVPHEDAAERVGVAAKEKRRLELLAEVAGLGQH